MEHNKSSVVALTTDIVVAFVGKHAMGLEAVPDLIGTVYAALTSLDSAPALSVEPTAPAVPIKKSITPDFLISLEDGKKYKSLKRHLRTKYNMSPDDYRAKWGLPRDYPMVAPNYAANRSALAKSMGLGRGGASGANTKSADENTTGSAKKPA